MAKIDHVAIAVRDFEKTIEFYTKHLGFTVIYWAENRPQDPKKLAFLQLGDSLLEIACVCPKWPITGLTHINLVTEDILKDVRKLEQTDVKFVRKPTEDSKYAMFIGPEGVFIEMHEVRYIDRLKEREKSVKTTVKGIGLPS